MFGHHIDPLHAYYCEAKISPKNALVALLYYTIWIP